MYPSLFPQVTVPRPSQVLLCVGPRRSGPCQSNRRIGHLCEHKMIRVFGLSSHLDSYILLVAHNELNLCNYRTMFSFPFVLRQIYKDAITPKKQPSATLPQGEDCQLFHAPSHLLSILIGCQAATIYFPDVKL